PVGITLVVDGLSAFMLMLINFLGLIVTIFSVNYIRNFTAKTKFYMLILIMIAGMNGVVMSGDIFNLFVLFEVASLASYALVAFQTEAEEFEAAFKYAIMGVVGSLFLLLAIAFLYSATSTLNMADMARMLAEKGKNNAVIFASVLLIAGFALKSGFIPFHGWLADAYSSAPAPVSALFSGIFSKALGLYALCRVFFNVIGVNQTFLSLLMFLGAASIVIGGLLALGQTDSKRMMAYSSISQIGYIILGFGIGTPLSIFAALFHLFNHAMFKSLLFLNTGSLEYAAGTRNLEHLGGLRARLPITSATSLIATMSTCGIPPFSGFFSKLLIITACIEAGRFGYAALAVAGAILTISYLMKFQKHVFFGRLKESLKNVLEVPFLMRAPMVILALICVFGAFLTMPKIANSFIKPAQESLSSGIKYNVVASGVINEK
ncbi:MAG: proton-conducting transporter membrane subunit, partial [Candidatus Omnitrophica bacterium]|nr:proton-conducting transporter membrane subunit [Candidatus Omnitrophota bacterium]